MWVVYVVREGLVECVRCVCVLYYHSQTYTKKISQILNNSKVAPSTNHIYIYIR